MIISEFIKRNQISGRIPLIESIQQIIKFGLVGLANTAVDWGLYFLLTASTFPVPISTTVAKGIAYLGGTANSSFFNHRWTFRSSRPIREIILPFFLVSGIGTVLNAATLLAATQHWNLNEPYALVAATALAFAWNFLINKFVIFWSPSPQDDTGKTHD